MNSPTLMSTKMFKGKYAAFHGGHQVDQTSSFELLQLIGLLLLRVSGMVSLSCGMEGFFCLVIAGCNLW